MFAHETMHRETLDAVMQRQVNDLVRQGLDTSLKLSLLSEAWAALQRGHLIEPYRAEDFARRLCADSSLVLQQLDEMVGSGFFERSPSPKCGADTYALTTDPVRRDALRRLLLSWGDLRFRMRANAMLAFRPGTPRKIA